MAKSRISPEGKRTAKKITGDLQEAEINHVGDLCKTSWPKITKYKQI